MDNVHPQKSPTTFIATVSDALKQISDLVLFYCFNWYVQPLFLFSGFSLMAILLLIDTMLVSIALTGGKWISFLMSKCKRITASSNLIRSWPYKRKCKVIKYAIFDHVFKLESFENLKLCFDLKLILFIV